MYMRVSGPMPQKNQKSKLVHEYLKCSESTKGLYQPHSGLESVSSIQNMSEDMKKYWGEQRLSAEDETFLWDLFL